MIYFSYEVIILVQNNVWASSRLLQRRCLNCFKQNRSYLSSSKTINMSTDYRGRVALSHVCCDAVCHPMFSSGIIQRVKHRAGRVRTYARWLFLVCEHNALVYWCTPWHKTPTTLKARLQVGDPYTPKVKHDSFLSLSQAHTNTHTHTHTHTLNANIMKGRRKYVKAQHTHLSV